MKIAIVVMGLALTLGVAGLGGCGGADERKAQHISKGVEWFADGNYEKARLEFKNALQIDPKDTEARFRLGETLEKLQQWRAAAGHYKAVVEQDPTHKEARVGLAKLYLVGNAPDEAIALVDEVLAMEPTNPEALVIRAGVKARGQDLEGALVDARSALAADPVHVGALSLAAAIHLQQGRDAESVALLESGVAAHPANQGLRSSLAAVYARTGEQDKAAAILEDVVSTEPETVDHRLRLASFYTAAENLDKAEEVLRAAVVDLPTETNAKLALVEFLAKRRGGDAAIAALEDFVQKDPENVDLLFAQAKLYQAMGRAEDEKAIYEGIIATDSTGKRGLEARNLLARLKVREGDREEARRLVDAVLGENSKDVDALALRGDLAMLDRDFSGAIGDYRAVLQARPQDDKVALALSRAHLANSENALAEEVLRDALERSPGSYQLRFRLAEMLAAGGDVTASVAQLGKILEQRPTDDQALEALVKIHLGRKDWASARDYVDRYKQAYPQRPQGYYFEGLLLQAQGDLSEGTAAFERSLEQAGSGAVQPLSAVVRSHVAAGDNDKALERVDEVLADNPDNFVARNLKGEILLLQKEYPLAEESFAQAVAQAPNLVAAHRNLALARFAQGEHEGAVNAFRQGIESTGAPALRFALANVLEGLGRPEEAILEHQAILDAAPDSLPAANNLAMLLASYRDDRESLDRALELAKAFADSDNAAYLDTLGWVHYKRGEYDAAMPLLERAVRANPDAPDLQFHLGMAHYRLGDRAAAKERLEKALATGTRFREAALAQQTLAELGGG